MKDHFQFIVDPGRNVVCAIECLQWFFVELFQWNFSNSYWKHKGGRLLIIKYDIIIFSYLMMQQAFLV